MKAKTLFLMMLAQLCCMTAKAVEAEIDGIWYELVSKAKEAKVINYKGTAYSGDIEIPSTVEYDGETYNVTSIGRSAFYGSRSITSVTIPSSVTTIGGGAFGRCTSLTAINIPSSVTSIGESTFNGCTSLTSVHISDLEAWCKISFNSYDSNPLYYAHHLYLKEEEVKDLVIPEGVTSIGGYAFSDCTSLTSITIPSSVTSIGNKAFSGCTSLTSISIPSSIISIGFDAFSGCTSLTSITIPSSVTTIEGFAFSGCTSLTSITIPSSVTSIGAWVFSDCTSLTSITIPSSVTSIGNKAFSGCTELTDMYCYAESLPSTESNAFEGSYIEYSTLHVPASAIESYRTTAPWSGFGKIVTLDGEEPVVPEPEQCAKPTIYYNNGKLSFKSETEGANFVSEIKDADVKKFYDSEIALGVTYMISVYATREGYKDSDVATATLCWIDVDPKKEGITEDGGLVTSVKEQKALPVLIQREGNKLSVSGAPAGTSIAIYDLSGRQLGASVASEDSTKVHLQTIERTIIVKIGSKSVKVALQ